MDPLFEVHMLNDAGKNKASEIADAFDTLLTELRLICGVGPSREMAAVREKLEEACMFAKKSMAMQPDNQVQPGTQATSA